MESSNIAEYDFVIDVKQPTEFGAFWESLRTFRTNCTLLMPKDGIYIRESNATNCISVSAYIDPRQDVCTYNTNYTNMDGTPSESGYVGFNVKEMAISTKKTTGAISILLLKRKDADNITTVQVTPARVPIKSYVQTELLEPTIFHEPDYGPAEASFNAFDFAGFFAKSNSAKALYVEMRVQSSRFFFVSYSGQKKVECDLTVPRVGSYVNPLSFISVNPLEALISSASVPASGRSSGGIDATFEIVGDTVIRMDKVVMKVLGKIHALCGKKSSVHIFYREGLPLKIGVQWGEFGGVSYYLIDNQGV